MSATGVGRSAFEEDAIRPRHRDIHDPETPDTVTDMWIGRQLLRVAVRPGEGRPLLLCNGIGASLDLLDPFVDALDPRIPVIRFDVPGIGGSALPRLPYTLMSLSRLLGSLLDELGYQKVDVLGISWGGGLAQQFAFQNPRRCGRAVLVATASGWMMVPAHPRVLRRMITPRRYRDSDYAASIAGDVYGGKLRQNPDMVRRLLGNHGRMTSWRGYLLQLTATAGWTSLPFLPLLRQPTLVLAGIDDPIIPMINARMMTKLLPHATLHVYPDGHLGLVASADELAPLVARFLRPRGQ